MSGLAELKGVTADVLDARARKELAQKRMLEEQMEENRRRKEKEQREREAEKRRELDELLRTDQRFAEQYAAYHGASPPPPVPPPRRRGGAPEDPGEPLQADRHRLRHAESGPRGREPSGPEDRGDRVSTPNRLRIKSPFDKPPPGDARGARQQGGIFSLLGRGGEVSRQGEARQDSAGSDREGSRGRGGGGSGRIGPRRGSAREDVEEIATTGARHESNGHGRRTHARDPAVSRDAPVPRQRRQAAWETTDARQEADTPCEDFEGFEFDELASFCRDLAREQTSLKRQVWEGLGRQGRTKGIWEVFGLPEVFPPPPSRV